MYNNEDNNYGNNNSCNSQGTTSNQNTEYNGNTGSYNQGAGYNSNAGSYNQDTGYSQNTGYTSYNNNMNNSQSEEQSTYRYSYVGGDNNVITHSRMTMKRSIRDLAGERRTQVHLMAVRVHSLRKLQA